MSATLHAFLRSSCRALGVEPRHLDDPSAAEDPLTALLQEAIALREEQRPELSLQVLEMACTAGLSSDWIDDNRARALLALDRIEEAEALLRRLCESNTAEIADAAQSLLAALSQSEATVEPDASADSGENTQAPQVMGAAEATDDNPELTALLERAILLREQGMAQLSLELLEHGAAVGHANPWLEDNRARALVNLGRRQEAEAIWAEQAAHQDPDVAAMAGAMATQLRAALLDELLEAAESAASAHGWQLRFLTPGLPSLQAAEEAVLEEAIASRDANQASLSLALVEAAQALGFTSPWLEDNRARALVNLGRRHQAMAVWQALAGCGEPALVGQAGDLAQEQAQLLVAELQERLARVAAEHGVRLEAVHAASGSPAELEQAILCDAIAARDFGRAEASLALLEAALQHGLPSGWLEDNRARALVHMQRPVEAVALWRQLQQAEEEALRNAAAEMLELYGREADRLATMAEAEALMVDRQPEAAIAMLSEAILTDPEWEGWREGLKRAVALQDNAAGSPDALLDQELHRPRLALKAFDAFLNAVEQRQGLRQR
jgi:hypothetical protein